jgi:hypothetical protein
LKHRPPVGEDYEYTGLGEYDYDMDIKTYDSNSVFLLATDVLAVKIDRELNTDDVVYTRIQCVVTTSINQEFHSYTYSMGNSLKFVLLDSNE